MPNAPHVAVLEGAGNTNIVGSSITISTFHQHDNSHGLELLLNHCCLGAQLDSKERFDPPRCAEATRVAITQEIVDWITNDDEGASMLVLHGSAGAGKSALEQTIAKLCQREGRLAAAFFLSRSSPNGLRRDGDAVIPTLVYQHIQVFPGLRELVMREIEDDPAIFQLSRAALMSRLVVKQFHLHTSRFPGYVGQPRLIALDGLDECNDHVVQCDLLRVIASAIPHLPYPFRFFIACRPESHLMALLKNDLTLRTGHDRILDLGEVRDVEADMQTFLIREFQRIRDTHVVGRYLPHSWPSATAMSRLIAQASGQFIYLQTAIKFVESPQHRPDNRLQIIQRLSSQTGKENPFADLDAIYSHIFSCVPNLDLVGRILGIMVLLSERRIIGLEYEDEVVFGRPSVLENVCMLAQGDIHLAMDQLGSLITVPTGDAPIKVLHASLFEFLLDESRSGGYALDISLADENIAKWRWSQIDFQATQEMEDEAIWYFLVHCTSAYLSESLLDMIGRVSTFLISFLDGRDEEWWLHSNRIGHYNMLLAYMTRVFDRTDFPDSLVSIDWIRTIAAKWHALEMEGIHPLVFQVFTPSANPPEWTIGARKKTRNAVKAQRISWLERLTDKFRPTGPIQSRQGEKYVKPVYLGRHILEQAKELTTGFAETPRARCVQHASMSIRLLFWIQRIAHDASNSSFSHLATCWILEAFYCLELVHDVASDAAILLFIASLLPYSSAGCSELEMDDEIAHRIRNRPYGIGLSGTSDHGLPSGAFPSEALRLFPKTVVYYRKQAAAYMKRVHPSRHHTAVPGVVDAISFDTGVEVTTIMETFTDPAL